MEEIQEQHPQATPEPTAAERIADRVETAKMLKKAKVSGQGRLKCRAAGLATVLKVAQGQVDSAAANLQAAIERLKDMPRVELTKAQLASLIAARLTQNIDAKLFTSLTNTYAALRGWDISRQISYKTKAASPNNKPKESQPVIDDTMQQVLKIEREQKEAAMAARAAEPKPVDTSEAERQQQVTRVQSWDRNSQL